MNSPTSLSLPEELRSQLEEEGRRLDAPVEEVARTVLDEGLRARRFPGITFRDGPTGRRAGLENGPDVWEIIRDLQSAPGDHAARVALLRDEAALTLNAIALAERYYERYRAEIDHRIEMNYRVLEEVLQARARESGTAGVSKQARADRENSTPRSMSR